MSRTINRLSDRNGLYSVSREENLSIPLFGKTYVSSSVEISNSSSAAYTLTTTAPISDGDLVHISDAISASPTFSGLDGEKRVFNVQQVDGVTVFSASPVYGLSFLPSAIDVAVSANIVPLYTYEWEFSCTKTLQSVELATQYRYAFKLSPSTTDPITISLSDIPLLQSDNGRRFSFNCLFKPSNTVTINAQLYYDDDTSPTAFSNTLYGGRYNAIRSNNIELPVDSSTHTVSIVIEIYNHNSGEPIYFTSPNLIDDQLYYDNIFVSEARNYMPDFYWNMDAVEQNPVAPFHKFIDAMTTVAGETREKYLEIFPFEKSEIDYLSQETIKYAQSTLVNPVFAENEYLDWLGQFVGAKVKKNLIDGNGDKYFPNIDAENEFARWQVITGYFGQSAGSRESMINAVKQVLTFTDDESDSTFAVALTPRYGNDPFSIRIQTLINETPDVTSDGEESQIVLNAVEEARPLGYKIVHSAASVFYFTIGDSTLGIIGGSAPLSPPSNPDDL